MAAPKGNQFWRARSSHGRDKNFSSASELWDAACEYFQWVEDNPLTEYKVAQFQGAPVPMELPKMRAMTIGGLCLFLGVNTVYFNQFESALKSFSQEEVEDFSKVIADIKQTIYEQKFSGAAADLLNANIISRELGLADKQDLNHSGKIGSELNIKLISAEMSAEEATRIYQDMINGKD